MKLQEFIEMVYAVAPSTYSDKKNTFGSIDCRICLTADGEVSDKETAIVLSFNIGVPGVPVSK